MVSEHPPGPAASASSSGTFAELQSRCAQGRAELRAHLDELAAHLDVGRAWRTVPLGSDARDPRRTPGVDFDVWVLHVRHQRTGGVHEMAALVEEYTPYARSLARRFLRHSEAAEDIEQVAMEALVAALRRFDVTRQIPFPAFATPTITGAIKRHYRDRGWSVRTPRSVHDLAPAVQQTEERLTAVLERKPTTEELAGELGVGFEAVDAVQVARRARTVASLDGPGAVEGSALADTVGAPDPELAKAENHMALASALVHLPARDRELIRLYYFEELSQREMATRYGVSQMQISRWLASIVARLRGHIVVDA